MLSAQSVTKMFLAGTPNVVRALDRLDLAIAEGDFVTVIGSNGAGKSTLLRSIAGLLVPEEGAIVLDGRDITRAAVHTRAAWIGRIAQDPHESTCAVMTIAENLAMAAKRGQKRGLARAITPELRENFRALLTEIGLGLEARLDARVGTLSGGQRQVLALLMATMAKPRLLLLDEHLANLDPKTAEAVMQLTDRLVQTNKLTTLMVTHNMHEAIRWGNRLVMMHAGRIIFEARDEAKRALDVPALVARFHEAARMDFADDRALLS